MNGAYAMSRLRCFFVAVVTLLGPGLISESCQAGFVVTSFAGSSYSANTVAMDAALGISGYTVEDFEDTALISGLTISFEGLIPENKSGGRFTDGQQLLGRHQSSDQCGQRP